MKGSFSIIKAITVFKTCNLEIDLKMRVFQKEHLDCETWLGEQSTRRNAPCHELQRTWAEIAGSYIRKRKEQSEIHLDLHHPWRQHKVWPHYFHWAICSVSPHTHSIELLTYRDVQQLSALSTVSKRSPNFIKVL